MFAPYKIATLIDTVAAQAVTADDVLAGTGLSLADVRHPHTLTSISQYLAACDNVVRVGVDLDVAYEVGSRLHLSAYGMYGYALMCSPTMRDFFDFAVRYHPLATPIQQLGWRRDGDVAVWTFTEIYGDLMSQDLRNFLLRQQMMMTSTHMRDVMGAGARPIRASFGLADIGRAAADEAALGCPCQFGQTAHELHYPAAVLDQAPELANRLTRAMLEDTCDRLVGQAKMATGVAGDVYQLLMLSPNRFPSMQAVAQRLGMTERTLRRRLDDDGHTYAGIVDDVRRTLTLEYLQTTRISADDIAWKVGFSDSANLRRAVRRWTGTTIGELRRG
ncbi:AraC family transcriptional regulator [Phenylobacterium sp. J367]|uniref:AraC family transcriptional regulator n=1 Tax=Phenylobacterium sp. J367 TaxID=2898435 RepID=UPI00215195B2|nr:AraC family transcriptional regulator [Phenylobacterium sp. J367]MCR5879239.1 AraC family transcriptional regulator [Phenylobacterium sp. J367]